MYSGTMRDHVEGFSNFSRHEVLCADMSILDTDIDIDQFDVIVLHYSLVIPKWHSDLPQNRRDKIINAKAIKMLFIQDEYRFINSVTEAIEEFDVKVLFTCQPHDVVEAIYKTHPIWKNPILSHVRFEYNLTGFVDDELLNYQVPEYKNRHIDVSYRARLLPFSYGRTGREKGLMAQKFLDSIKGTRLKCDISTDELERIYGDKWIQFVANSKATLGSESCVGIADFDNSLFAKIDEFCKAHPNANFEEVEQTVFPGLDGQIKFRAISPRCFEAAALRTLMVLYEGEYSGILEANRHYVKLERDHSNINEVVKIIKDPKEANKYIDCAYDEIANSGKWTMRAFIQNHFDQVVTEEVFNNPNSSVDYLRYPYKGFEMDVLKVKSENFQKTEATIDETPNTPTFYDNGELIRDVTDAINNLSSSILTISKAGLPNLELRRMDLSDKLKLERNSNNQQPAISFEETASSIDIADGEISFSALSVDTAIEPNKDVANVDMQLVDTTCETQAIRFENKSRNSIEIGHLAKKPNTITTFVATSKVENDVSSMVRKGRLKRLINSFSLLIMPKFFWGWRNK